MKSLKYIFFFVLIVIIGTSFYIATLDGNYNISAKKTIKVPTEVVFKNVNDYKNWSLWNPWLEANPTLVASFSEISTGVGSTYSWTGQKGLTSLKTISFIPNKEIIQEMDLGTNTTTETYWNFNSLKDSTEITWGFKGKLSFNEKIYWITKGGIELQLQPFYQRGLDLLEQLLLKEMDKHSTEFMGIVDHGGGYYLYQTVACKNEAAAEHMAKMFPVIFEYMAKNHIEPSGKPFTLNHQIDLANNTVMFSTCVPIKERIITEGYVLTGFLEPQTTFKTVFKGNYKFLNEVWPKIYKEIANQNLTPTQKGYSFEIYSIRPTDTPNPAEWLTEIYVPLKINEPTNEDVAKI
jgi:effector-binding domain-containing protein